MGTVYTPINWTSTTLLSARNFNLMETQFDCAKTFIDGHNHDSRYYLKNESNGLFFTAGQSSCDADTIDGLHWNDIVGAQCPPGAVLGWNGDDTDVPTGWHICDGSTINGILCPDIRGVFPVGAGGSFAAHATGGRTTISDLGGTATIGDHLLTLDEIPAHYHNWTDHYMVGNGPNDYVGNGGSVASPGTSTRTIYTGYNHDVADEPHNHGTKSITFNGFPIMPLYVAKYYICKVS